MKTYLGSSPVRVEALESTTVVFFILLHAEKDETLQITSFNHGYFSKLFLFSVELEQPTALQQ